MKGPTPIISSILKATAERRPMRRWRGAAELEEARGMRLFRSPDCTLATGMIRIERAFRAVVFAGLASLAAAGALPLAAQQAAQPPAIPASKLASIPPPEP